MKTPELKSGYWSVDYLNLLANGETTLSETSLRQCAEYIEAAYKAIDLLESDTETLKGSLEMWKSVASSPGAVEDMARENYMLTERLAQVERERDAAVADLRLYAGCKVCKFGDLKFPNDCMDCIRMCNWEWRGICPKNTKEEEK